MGRATETNQSCLGIALVRALRSSAMYGGVDSREEFRFTDPRPQWPFGFLNEGEGVVMGMSESVVTGEFDDEVSK